MREYSRRKNAGPSHVQRQTNICVIGLAFKLNSGLEMSWQKRYHNITLSISELVLSMVTK
jgi:hypothetical protein